MTIRKFGHCCLLLETDGKRILVDPGRFSTEQDTLTNIDIVLITHEHADHYHSESVAAIMENNPKAAVVTNTSVAKLLAALGIEPRILEGRATDTVNDVSLVAYDGEHVEIYEDFGIVQNTGYLVEGTFFFPGDAYTVPDETVDILALPIAGPWCKISDAIDYGIAVAPRIAIPVHDATLSDTGAAVTHPHFVRELGKHNIVFTPLTLGEATTLLS
jgi:L-ascorbate metabolism protein UlaG (beta-lactamase superfamily)